MSSEPPIRNHAAFIWSVADKLRGVYKQSEYGRVILPLVVLRRLACVLEPTKAEVLARAAKLKGRLENVGPVLESVSGIREVYNTSPLDFRRPLEIRRHHSRRDRSARVGEGDAEVRSEHDQLLRVSARQRGHGR